MYLPRNLPLCPPHVATWIGDSGKRYDFAVTRLASICVDEPAVYILARHEGDQTVALYIGQTGSLHRYFALSRDRCPAELRQALSMRLTHVHLRFDACSKDARQAEVRDLVAALRPALNAPTNQEPELMKRALETVTLGTRVPVTGTHAATGFSLRNPFASMPTREQQSLVANAAGRAAPPWVRPPLTPDPPFRADPAREEDDEPADSALVEDNDPMPAAPAPAQTLPDTATHADQVQPPRPEPSPPTPQATHAQHVILPSLSGLLARVLAHARPRAPVRWTSADRAVTETPAPAAIGERVMGAGDRVTESSHAITASVRPVAHAEAIQDGRRLEIASAQPGGVPGEGIDDAARLAPSATPPDLGEPRASVQQEPHPAGQQEPRPDSQEELHPAEQQEPRPAGQQEIKRHLGLDPAAPAVLFAGELSYDSGVDILMDAIITVCGDNRDAFFVFAGDGPSRSELQAQASRAGLGQRCRFLGDVPAEAFESVLSACDFVVIPAHKPRGEDLARMAIAHGKPVLTTHQASIGAVAHGHNGLVTYDNPGSLVWGIRELLGPIYADLRRHLSVAAMAPVVAADAINRQEPRRSAPHED